MAHSIELLFDRDTESEIRRIWDAFADDGTPSRAPAGRPHVTLVAADHIDSDVDALLGAIARQLPMDCTVGAPLLFGSSNAVLARLIVPTVELLTAHAEVHGLCRPHLVSGPAPTSAPRQWTPHVTLARRVGAAHLDEAMRIAGQPPQINGSFAALRRWDGTNRVEYSII